MLKEIFWKKKKIHNINLLKLKKKMKWIKWKIKLKKWSLKKEKKEWRKLKILKKCTKEKKEKLRENSNYSKHLSQVIWSKLQWKGIWLFVILQIIIKIKPLLIAINITLIMLMIIKIVKKNLNSVIFVVLQKSEISIVMIGKNVCLNVINQILVIGSGSLNHNKLKKMIHELYQIYIMR